MEGGVYGESMCSGEYEYGERGLGEEGVCKEQMRERGRS
jgi:hypothetical protein